MRSVLLFKALAILARHETMIAELPPDPCGGDFGLRYANAADALPNDLNRLVELLGSHIAAAIHRLRHERDLVPPCKSRPSLGTCDSPGQNAHTI